MQAIPDKCTQFYSRADKWFWKILWLALGGSIWFREIPNDSEWFQVISLILLIPCDFNATESVVFPLENDAFGIKLLSKYIYGQLNIN